jgi:hypothetical protein
MRTHVDIDEKTSRAITREIGERLRADLREESELPASLKKQIDRLHELEGEAPLVGPAAERGFENKPRKDGGRADRSHFTWPWRGKS